MFRLLGTSQPGQCGRAGTTLAFVGTRVGETGQDPLGLLELAQRCAAGGGRRIAGAQPVDELARRLDGLVVVELPVDHHHRREVARRVALDVLQGDRPVVGGLAVADAEVVFERIEDRVAAHHRAQRVRAHPDQVVAGGSAPVHGVKACDSGDFGAGQAELRAAELDTGRRHVAVLRLHQVQQRQQRRARARVAADDLLGVDLQPGLHVGRVDLRCAVGDELAGLLRGRPEPEEHPLAVVLAPPSWDAAVIGPPRPSPGRYWPPR